MLVYFTQTELPARFGISISKKQLPLSTQRNRIKRRVFEGIQEILKNSPSLTGDYFFVLSARITRLSPIAMRELIKNAIQLGEKSKTLS